MKLEDLLVSYKAVLPPVEEYKEEVITNPYERLEQYKASKQEETQTNVPELDEYIFPGWKEIVQSVYPQNKSQKKSIPASFTQQFDSYLRDNPQDADTRDILTSIARLESSFDPSAKNFSSSALGYFQFLDSTRKDYDSSSREEFSNDPQKQFAAAVKHYRKLKKSLIPFESAYKARGLTPLQAMYGMWWRPKSFIEYVKKGKDNYVNPDGMTIEKILERAKNG